MGPHEGAKNPGPAADRPREILRAWKIGGSLAITVPFRVARDLNLRPGDQVRVRFAAIEVSEAPPALVATQRADLLARLGPALGWLAQFDQP